MSKADGLLTNLTSPDSATSDMSYDLVGQLLNIEERKASGELHTFFSFGHDAGGRVEWRFELPRPAVNAGEALAPMTYDDDNRVATWSGQVVTYDDDGNMTRGPLPSGVLADYVFDARNHLKSAGGESYSYDAEGNRVSLTNAAGTTRFVIDPNGGPMSRVLVRERPDTTKVLHVYAGSLLLYEVEAATDTPRYFHSDHVGNTVALSNAAGAITDRITYTPFGSITSRTGTSDTPFLFGGALGCATSSNGLVHMRARYYQPKLGRFINQDPIGFEGGTNWYGYCDNDPISNTDPSGLYFGLDDAVAAGAGSVIGLAVQGGMDLYHGKMSPGSHYLAAAAGGAIAGAGTLYIGPGGLGLGTAAAAGISGAAGGAYANTIRQSADISSGRQDSFSGTSLALETGLGGAGSVIGAKVLPAVLGGLSNATKGSIGETTSLITNLARGNVPLGGEGIGRLAGAYTWWRKNSAMGLAI